jgi:hypothetical protein
MTKGTSPPHKSQARTDTSQLGTPTVVKLFSPLFFKRNYVTTRCQWLKPVILATQEAEIRRIMVQSQPRQRVHETLSQKKNITKKD